MVKDWMEAIKENKKALTIGIVTGFIVSVVATW
jgi:hypothetical protein